MTPQNHLPPAAGDADIRADKTALKNEKQRANLAKEEQEGIAQRLGTPSWRPTFLGSHHPWTVSTEMEAASLNHKVLPERFGVCVCVYIDL